MLSKQQLEDYLARIDYQGEYRLVKDEAGRYLLQQKNFTWLAGSIQVFTDPLWLV